MRLRQIEVFHAVYVNGSISAAARALNVSQPAVSKVLRHTETQLGIRLFDLVRGRLVPTDEAHALYREADEVFARISSLQLTAGNLRHSGAGHLRIGVVPSLGLEVVPAAITAFRAANRGVTFNIQTLNHRDVLRSLHERECDLAIGYDPPDHPRLKLRKLADTRLVLIAPPGRFGQGVISLPVKALEGVEMIGITRSGPIADIVRTALAKAQVDVHEVVSVSTYYVAAALVRFGTGVAIVDEVTARSIAGHGLDRITLQPDLQVGIHAASLEDRPLSKLGLGFAAAVEDALNSHLAAAGQAR